MAAKPNHKDGPRPASVVPSTGTHVVAVLQAGDVVGYVRNLGDTRNGHTTQGEARRFTPDLAEKRAKMENDAAARTKSGLTFEAREFEDLFGGEA